MALQWLSVVDMGSVLSAYTGLDVQAVIFDCSGISFVDSSGARLLIQVSKDKYVCLCLCSGE